LKLVSASKEPPTVFDMAPVWFRLCCALVDNQKDDAVQTLRDMNRVSNTGVNMSPQDLNIGALASLQVISLWKTVFRQHHLFVAGYWRRHEELGIQVDFSYGFTYRLTCS
jgi:hypothetical protein